MRFLKVIVTTIIIILAIVFIVENLGMLRHTVNLRLDLYLVRLQTPDMPLWVMVLFCFFLGAFTASLYGIYEVIVQRQTIRQLKQNLEILAQELKAAETSAAPEESKTASRPE
jgi:uncharacterized integral membrane protein